MRRDTEHGLAPGYRTPPSHGRLLAHRQLPLGRPDLPARQPAPEGTPEDRARQAAAPGPLGHHAGPELRLRAPEPRHQAIRSEHDLSVRPRPRRTGAGRQHVPRGDLQRAVHEHHPGRVGVEAAVQAVLFPRRDPQSRGARDARLDPRRGRAGLQPEPCLRRGVRQPRPDRRLRHRRRRGRDRPPGHELAQQQVPGSRARRRRAADPPPERLQDRQPDGPGPHRPRRAGGALAWLWLYPLLRRGSRARSDAPAHGDRRSTG